MRSRRNEVVPAFATEAEERRYWETHDSSGHVNWDDAKRASFANLKRRTEKVSE
jgi:hypothetical protein